METSEALRGLECTETGDVVEAVPTGRSDAGAPLDPAYDYDATSLDRTAVEHAGSMWDLDRVLPVPATVAVSAGEGGTPLVDVPGLADELGVGRVVLKDEGRNPTGTVLDRGLSLAVSAVVATGTGGDGANGSDGGGGGGDGGGDDEARGHVALAAPGNAAQSAAAYAGRAGLDAHAFVPSRAAFSNKAMVNVHGGDMRVVGGRFPDALEACEDALADHGEWQSLQEFTTPYRHEGAKTVAYELLADLDWTVPDAVFVPVGSGELLVGLVKGLRECRRLGFVDALPPVVAAQASGCAPVVAAWGDDRDRVEPWETPDTICGELEIPAPAGGRLALSALAETGGDAVAVDDPDVLESAVAVTQRAGVEVGAGSGAAAAAAWELAGRFDDEATLAVVNAESGGKTADVLRSHLMGQGV